MKSLRRLSYSLLLPFILFASVACADKSDSQAASFEAGVHYQVLSNPARTLKPNKIAANTHRPKVEVRDLRD